MKTICERCGESFHTNDSLREFEIKKKATKKEHPDFVMLCWRCLAYDLDNVFIKIEKIMKDKGHNNFRLSAGLVKGSDPDV